jgi:hypothetical protein
MIITLLVNDAIEQMFNQVSDDLKQSKIKMI